MKSLIQRLIGRRRVKRNPKTISDYKQEMLVRQGREQFKKLLDKGLSVPVALL